MNKKIKKKKKKRLLLNEIKLSNNKAHASIKSLEAELEQMAGSSKTRR